MTPLQKTHLTVGVVIGASLIAYLAVESRMFLVLPGLMSIGLIRAGITGTCPMTNLFAKFTS